MKINATKWKLAQVFICYQSMKILSNATRGSPKRFRERIVEKALDLLVEVFEGTLGDT